MGKGVERSVGGFVLALALSLFIHPLAISARTSDLRSLSLGLTYSQSIQEPTTLTPKKIMQWVIDHVGEEDPDHMNILYFPEDAWKAVLEHRNIDPRALAFVTEEDIQNERLRIWARAEGVNMDYIWVHETLHYILSRTINLAHSEGTTHAASITVMCGGPQYLEWRDGFDETMDLGVRLGGITERQCRRYVEQNS